MRTDTGRTQRLLSDAALLVLLTAASAGVAAFCLFVLCEPDWLRRDHAGYLAPFSAPLMLACGKGLVEPVSREAPGLNEFLQQRSLRFLPSQLPKDFPTTEPGDWVQQHRYFFYVVGIAWRVFGISWTVLKVLLILFFCSTVAIVYGLFRLGMNRCVSAMAAVLFMLSPVVLSQLPTGRDFCKAPFILAAILIMGHLAKTPLKMPRLLALSALLGLVQGIGLGFRHDVIICLPPSVLVLALCTFEKPGVFLARRLTAIALMAASFLAAAWPVMSSYQSTGTPSTDLIMGMATVCDDNIGLRRASYQRVYTMHDSHVYAITTNAYARHVDRPIEPIPHESEAAGRYFLLEVAKTFPADLLTRAYAAVLFVIEGNGAASVLRYPLRAYLGLCLASSAILTLLLLSRHSLRLGWITLLLALYFCGYISLQFQFRHCFHLAFVAIWSAGFLVDKLLFAARQLYKPAVRQKIKDILRSPRNAWTPPLRRMILFGIAAAALLLIPLYAARAYQYLKVGLLLEQYASADLEAMPSDQTPLQDWVLFRPTKRRPARSQVSMRADWPFQNEYWVAEFAPSAEKRPYWLLYETKEGSAHDFSHVLRRDPAGAPGEGTTKCFLPVYECSCASGVPGWAGWTRFAGIALLKQHAADFRGFHTVADVNPFPLLLNLCLPARTAAFRRCQTLQFFRKGLDTQFGISCIPVCGDPFNPTIPGAAARPVTIAKASLALKLKQKGDLDAAIAVYRDGLALDPNNIRLLMGLGKALEAKGDIDGARQTYRQAIAAAPDFHRPYACLRSVFAARNDRQGYAAECRDITRKHPDMYPPYFWLGKALDATGDVDGAVKAYYQAVALGAWDSDTFKALAQALAEKGDFEAACDAYRKVIEAIPDFSASAARELLERASDFIEEGRLDKAIEGYRAAASMERSFAGRACSSLADAAGDFIAKRRWGEALMLYQGANTIKTSCGEKGSRVLAQAAFKAGEKGLWTDAADGYRAALTLDPHNPSLHLELGQALAQKRDPHHALDAYRTAVSLQHERLRNASEGAKAATTPERTFAERASSLLAEVASEFVQEGRWDSAVQAYRVALSLKPETPWLLFAIGNALTHQADFHTALDAYRQALRLPDAPPGEAPEGGHADPTTDSGSAERASTLLATTAFELAQNGRWDRAIEGYRAAVALDPDNPWRRISLGDAHVNQGDLDGALDAYRRAITLGLHTVTAYHKVDAVFVARDDTQGRLAEWRCAVQRHPEAASAHLFLATALECDNDRERAIAAFHKACQLAPSDPEVQTGVGLGLVRLGAYQDAVEPLRTSLRLTGDQCGHIRLALITALCETGDYDSARQEANQCREMGIVVPQELIGRLTRATDAPTKGTPP